ncbi:ATP-binding protein [Halomicrobium urmianum]|uniref:ATP-binding protein n=1 Tax=Halomicrobium urmianum TaxID=1586233 RepID=UPI001CDA4CC7|nr:ATP-binding protein [Halomicrobium urmianum]
MVSNRPSPALEAADSAPTALCVLSEGIISYANPSTAALLGRDADALAGDRFLDHVAPADRERVDDALEGPIEGERTVRFELADPENRRTIVEGEWTGDDEGDVVGTLRDVTGRIERERRLERESEMLDSLLEHIPMSVYFKDRQSRHERVSQHMICPDLDSCIVGPDGKHHHHPEDIHGKTDFDLYDPAFAAEAVEDDRQVVEEEETVYDRVDESTTPLGETFFSSTTKVPRYDDEGDVVGLVGVTMDVTDRMSYERELERQNERLEEFTEVLSHDLRNPLTVARTSLGAVDDDVDHPRIEPATDALDRISALIDEVRTFVIEGRTVEDPDVADLATAAEDAWQSVDTGAADLKVEVSHRIRADYDRLQRLLENVFRNAVEHGSTSPDSQPRQDAVEHGSTGSRSSETHENAVEHAAGPDGEVTVTVGDLETGFYVADDGPGVPDDLRDEVFERGVTTSDDGTGFGLAIVRNIAEAHDWTVSVTDADDGGARFEIADVVRVEDGSTGHR